MMVGRGVVVAAFALGSSLGGALVWGATASREPASAAGSSTDAARSGNAVSSEGAAVSSEGTAVALRGGADPHAEVDEPAASWDEFVVPQVVFVDGSDASAPTRGEWDDSGDERAAEEGVPLSETLGDLERRYRELVARADELEARLAEDAASRLAAAQPTAPTAQPGETEAARGRTVAAAELSSPPLLEQGTALSDTGAVRDSRMIADSRMAADSRMVNGTVSHQLNEQNNTVVINHYNSVWWGAPTVEERAPPVRRPSSPRSSDSLSQQHQRAVLQPWTSSRTPFAGGARTPWDPIDMSKHHNPWSGSRLP